jgi:RNA polymerase sigma-70 factor, ECF subfamily
MSATVPAQGSAANAVKTLGDVIYANRSRQRESEATWVSLVNAIAAGDQLALHSLYERTHRLVFTLIVRICKSRETAEELTVDVFHDVWRRAAAYSPEGGTVVGWIMNQARSRAIDRLRFEQRKKRVNPHPDEPLADEPEARDQSTLDELAARMTAALETLMPEEQRAIELAYFSGLTYAEVAVRQNQPLGTVKSRIRSGLAKLRVVLMRSEEES